jgi:hypothetical protein
MPTVTVEAEVDLADIETEDLKEELALRIRRGKTTPTTDEWGLRTASMENARAEILNGRPHEALFILERELFGHVQTLRRIGGNG